MFSFGRKKEATPAPPPPVLKYPCKYNEPSAAFLVNERTNHKSKICDFNTCTGRVSVYDTACDECVAIMKEQRAEYFGRDYD
jgi:hypothetical protein